MKIVYIYEGLPAYRKDFFCLLNKRIQQKGDTLEVLYGKKERNESLQINNELGFNTKQFTIKEIFNKGAIRVISFPKMFQYFKKEKPDVFVLQFHVATLTYWRLYLYSRFHGIPYITWDCNYQKPELGGASVKIRKYLTYKVYKGARVCLTYGTKFRDELLGIGRKPEDVIVAQNTINVERIIENRAVSCGNREYNHPLRILYVGVVNSRKNVEDAITAVAKLIKEGKNIYFDVVGGGDSFESCRKLITELKVDDNIVMHGPKHGKEVQEFFEQSDLFLMPGTGGLAINEAMAYSLPIISTEGDGTVIDLIDGNGYMLNHFGDVDEIKETIMKFINLSTEEKQRMSKRSEEIVIQKALLENMVDRHIEAIEKCLENT